MPNPSQTFAKNEEERIHPNSFYEANIIPKPKPEKGTIRGENYRSRSLTSTDAKTLNKNIPNESQYIFKDYTSQPNGIHPREAMMMNHTKINITHDKKINERNKKNTLIDSIML